jgi:hypothetical protein
LAALGTDFSFGFSSVVDVEGDVDDGVGDGAAGPPLTTNDVLGAVGAA